MTSLSARLGQIGPDIVVVRWWCPGLRYEEARSKLVLEKDDSGLKEHDDHKKDGQSRIGACVPHVVWASHQVCQSQLVVCRRKESHHEQIGRAERVRVVPTT